MNDANRLEAPQPISPDQQWQARLEGPWPSAPSRQVTILAVKEGWVRYYLNGMWPDERLPEGVFRRLYEPVGLGT